MARGRLGEGGVMINVQKYKRMNKSSDKKREGATFLTNKREGREEGSTTILGF